MDSSLEKLLSELTELQKEIADANRDPELQGDQALALSVIAIQATKVQVAAGLHQAALLSKKKKAKEREEAVKELVHAAKAHFGTGKRWSNQSIHAIMTAAERVSQSKIRSSSPDPYAGPSMRGMMY
jgi:hypothetical protein